MYIPCILICYVGGWITDLILYRTRRDYISQKWPVMWSFDIFFAVSLEKLLKKQMRRCLFVTPWGSYDVAATLRWRHNGRDGVANHQPHECVLNSLFRRRSKKTSKLRVTCLCEGNSPVTGDFPAQMASDAENVSIWWRHHDCVVVSNTVCTALFVLWWQNHNCQKKCSQQVGVHSRCILVNTLRPRQNNRHLKQQSQTLLAVICFQGSNY